MKLIIRDISQSITTTEGQICEIEDSKSVVLKTKGHAPNNRIEILVEKVNKLDDGTYQGKIRGFKAEYGQSLIREDEQGGQK
ncbi:hypothetical protein L4D76_00520 [Photobacterium sagamiensis]|uniref:hypothetical protein n=1 Tax=Photobacterium sagamiensis TaxID=2910241 RepID=UPI003D0A6F8A